jgi:hypothetical protein
MPEAPCYLLGPRVARACRVVPYQRTAGDPVSRPLRIFAFDPAESRLLGNVAVVRVPWEPLRPGPVGALFEVEGGRLGGDGAPLVPLDLERPSLLLEAGLEPTQSRPQFHMQMTYAVCSSVYDRFRSALGRTVAWGFDEKARDAGAPFRLRIRPIAERNANAYYDPEQGELAFGYFEADRVRVTGRNLPGGFVFTSLAHDIVAHECTHAMLDGLRAQFTTVTHVDVAAFHEGFADLIAVLHRFSHAEVVHKVLELSKGRLDTPAFTSIGRQFGEASGEMGPIRLVSDEVDPGTGLPRPYDAFTEEHERGRSLAAAIFEAFTRIFDRKKRKLVLLATGGRGVIPDDEELPSRLVDALTDLARDLAGQFMNICIRAIDYCPPVDVRFGDFLRAAITADFDLVPDDPYGYREAWIDAFRRRGIYPHDVPNLGEDALLWRGPEIEIPPARRLSFAALQFDGDPGRPPSGSELRRQAEAVGDLVTAPGRLGTFGLCDPGDPEVLSKVLAIDLPTIESVRVARRVGPDGQVAFDLVAEVTQRAVRQVPGTSRPIEVYGGSTIILDADGRVRYAIRKRLLNDDRAADTAAVASRTDDDRQFWSDEGKEALRPRRGIFRALHARRARLEVAPDAPPA